ncbi:uncharacterized protein LOC119919686 [Tachyglossus aculeatus]|uniref:uncharacterized protein LOC119919686 n=1 Tax=Tachyglossus aculeatus TaxID=9261 RepID=UPI0018F2CF3E|nr:uncharacterized protein LOC119919686 [Tachyglossus aculeatus]
MTFKNQVETKGQTSSPPPWTEMSNSFLEFIESNTVDRNANFPFSLRLSSPEAPGSLEYMPYFRTHGNTFIIPWPMEHERNAHATEVKRERGGSPAKAYAQKTNEMSEDSIPASGYFPYYRTEEDLTGSLLLQNGLCKTCREDQRQSGEGRKGTTGRSESGCSTPTCYRTMIPSPILTQSEITPLPTTLQLPDPLGSFPDENLSVSGMEISVLGETSLLREFYIPTGYTQYYRTEESLLGSHAPHLFPFGAEEEHGDGPEKERHFEPNPLVEPNLLWILGEGQLNC